MRVVTHLTVIALVAALGTVTLATSAWSAGGRSRGRSGRLVEHDPDRSERSRPRMRPRSGGLPVAPGLSGDRAGRSVRGPLGHG